MHTDAYQQPQQPRSQFGSKNTQLSKLKKKNKEHKPKDYLGGVPNQPKSTKMTLNWPNYGQMKSGSNWYRAGAGHIEAQMGNLSHQKVVKKNSQN